MLVQHATANGFGPPQAVVMDEGPDRLVLSLTFTGKASTTALCSTDKKKGHYLGEERVPPVCTQKGDSSFLSWEEGILCTRFLNKVAV